MILKIKKDRLRLVLLLFFIVLMSAGAYLIFEMWGNGFFSNQHQAGQSPSRDTYLEHEGVRYKLRDDVETILVMGLDKFEQTEIADGYLNDQQADFLVLLVLDRTEKRCYALHLNRDTMANIPVIGVTGNGAGMVNAQLALAHTYGSGGSDSCLNTTKAVSNLLCGIPIDHYISLTMEAVGILNDLVGGVEVTVLDDFSSVAPELVKGQTIKLNAEQALLYVRSRTALQDSTNLARMERQKQYIEALSNDLLIRQRTDAAFAETALKELLPYVQTDYTPNQLVELIEGLTDFQMETAMSLKGESVKGAEFMEFYVDESAMKQTLIELLFAKQA